ncbi:Hemerythrin-like metal-binding protein [Acidobacteriia bacterium SbA2]|nr:Hemerythrin-like metal-binding protein [Acidobacteriia bacterium SbA2]
MLAAKDVLFHWDSTYSVNIGILDTQHKTLVAMVNDLHQAMTEGSGKDKLRGILSNLVKYTQAHFATEERLMQSHGYPDFLAHKSQHEDLTNTVLDLQSRFLSNQVGLSIEVMEFLKDWLVKHILGSDKKYTPFLNAKGVR